MNEAYCLDCMKAMSHIPDKYFDLAVVDPPYGHVLDNCSQIVQSEIGLKATAMQKSRFGERFNRYYMWVSRTGGIWAKKYQKSPDGIFSQDISDWDIAPTKEYFDELSRVSKNQIIWGGNYFGLPPTRCFLIWRKLQIPLEGFSMAPCEYAWTSFNDNAAMFESFSSTRSGKNQEYRFHPTQKPVGLYTWIYRKFSKPGYKILDTHLGSGSSRIAAYDMGLDFVGFEIDKTYFDLQNERFELYVQQENLIKTDAMPNQFEQMEIGGI